MMNLELDDKKALCAAIRTSRYARKVVTLLRDYADGLYKTDGSYAINDLGTTMDDELAAVFQKLLAKVNTSNPMDAEHALRTVIDYLKDVEEIGFVVPIHPQNEFVERLYEWCSTNISGEVLIDFTTNRLMESGLLMVYKGKYFEYSLENLLNDYLASHQLATYFDKATSVDVSSASQQSEQNSNQTGGQA